MDIENIGNYRYYKCRSLLACDTGGTVIDTTKRCDEPVYPGSFVPDESQSESSQSEQIIYFLSPQSEVEKTVSLDDSNTHLDDDEFNDYNGSSNVSNKPECGIIKYYPSPINVECRDASVQKYNIAETSTDEYILPDVVPNHQNFVTCNQQYVPDSDYVRQGLFCYKNNNQIQTEAQIRHFSKRKQTYNIKQDSFTEVLHENSLSKPPNPDCSSNKRRVDFDKEKMKENFHLLKNPFANLKMNSILKKSIKQSPKEKNQTTQERKETLKFSNQDLTFNLEFKNADYLDHLEPREQVIESDMDKLLTPTIDSTNVFESLKKRLDCNGNEISHGVTQPKSYSKSSLSPNELVERELLFKSACAKKLGLVNLFNTSNDSVIKEILSDPNHPYKNIKLDTSFTTNEQFYPKSNAFRGSCTLIESLNELNRFGGLAEEDRGYSIVAEEVPQATWNNKGSHQLFQTFQRQDTHTNVFEKFKQNHQYYKKDFYTSVSNFYNQPKSVNFDIQAKAKHVNCSPTNNSNNNTNNDGERKSAPLIVKIKKENNEYISSIQSMNFSGAKSTILSTKIIDRYECHDCSEKFRTKKILMNHVSVFHKGPYDTECDKCHMKFKKSSAHKKHHPWCLNNKVYPCMLCEKVYCYQASLKKHLKAHHSDIQLV